MFEELTESGRIEKEQKGDRPRDQQENLQQDIQGKQQDVQQQDDKQKQQQGNQVQQMQERQCPGRC